MELLKLCHPRKGKPKYILVSGPRFATKSIGCYHAIVDHLWTVKNAKFSVVSPTVTAGDDQGCWTEITQSVIPKWIDGKFGMEWVSEPRQKGTTKKLYAQVTNMHGGVSTIQLDSLQFEADVEGRFKNKNHSGMYLSEASYYKNRKTFDIMVECMRGENWKEEDFTMILDTNPAEEGQDSWLWKLFYAFRVQNDVDDNAKIFQKNLALMEFTVEDNIFVSKERLDEQLARYAHSEDLTARYRYGKWVRAVGSSIFYEQFKPLIHIIGGHETPNHPDPEVLMPEENCDELITGWDIGTGPNSAFMIAEKITQNLSNGKTVSAFKFLDEVVYIGSDASMTDFVAECVEKIDFWESVIGRPVRWRNWSDRSAFDIRERISNVYHHQLVAQMSDNRIILQAADRSPGSVSQRVNMGKKLLFENRIFISRSRCPNLIDSFQSLRPGKGNIAIQKTSPFKHAYDAASYLFVSECFDEIIHPRQDVRTGNVYSGLTSVPL